MSNKPAIIGIGVFSMAAVALLLWLIYGVETGSGDWDLQFLPALNAGFNAISAIALVVGIRFIRKGQKRPHGLSMAVAFGASSLFLIGYILHHTVNGDTLFLREDWLRPIYFFILISHILLSIIVLPMVLTTLFFAILRKWEAHRQLARWTWPAWLYVSVTGVLVFVFLRLLNTPGAGA